MQLPKKFEANESVITVRPANSHIPDYCLIDLDYPIYGTVVVKCDGRKYDLGVVKKALALVAALDGQV